MKYSFFLVLLLIAASAAYDLEITGTGYDQKGAVKNAFVNAVSQEIEILGDTVKLQGKKIILQEDLAQFMI